MNLIVPTFEDFKAQTVMGVIKNIATWIINTLVPNVNSELGKKADVSAISKVGKSGSYNDLTNKPTIPPAITVDQTLSLTSTNPIANKVIYAYVGTDNELIG